PRKVTASWLSAHLNCVPPAFKMLIVTWRSPIPEVSALPIPAPLPPTPPTHPYTGGNKCANALPVTRASFLLSEARGNALGSTGRPPALHQFGPAGWSSRCPSLQKHGPCSPRPSTRRAVLEITGQSYSSPTDAVSYLLPVP